MLCLVVGERLLIFLSLKSSTFVLMVVGNTVNTKGFCEEVRRRQVWIRCFSKKRFLLCTSVSDGVVTFRPTASCILVFVPKMDAVTIADGCSYD